jgi:hypothetical protein
MYKKFIFSLVLLLTASGCSIYHEKLDSNLPFSAHHYSNGDLEITWLAERSDSNIRLTGEVRNLRSYYYQDFELIARLMDASGKIISRKSFTHFPDYLPSSKSEPFQLDFHLPPGTRVEQILYRYFYWLDQGGPALDIPQSGMILSPP